MTQPPGRRPARRSTGRRAAITLDGSRRVRGAGPFTALEARELFPNVPRG